MLLRTFMLVSLFLIAPFMASSGTVPDFHGMTEAEALEGAQEAGFSPTIEVFPSAERLGRVFSQVPGAGSTMVGGEIVLRVSGGLVLPDVTGRFLEEVTSELAEMGLPWSVTRQAEPGLAPGLVARSEPAAGTTVDAFEQVVFLTVSNTEMVAVPSLAGVVLSQARSTLASLGLDHTSRAGRRITMGDTDQAESAHWNCVTVSEGYIVTAVDPSAGTELPKGSRVTLHYDTEAWVTVEPCTDDGTKL